VSGVGAVLFRADGFEVAREHHGGAFLGGAKWEKAAWRRARAAFSGWRVADGGGAGGAAQIRDCRQVTYFKLVARGRDFWEVV
jgi:hypothetical protein